MMTKVLLKNAKVVNEGNIFETDLLLEGDFIARMDKNISLQAKVPS